MMPCPKKPLILVTTLLIISSASSSSARDTITPSTPLADNETLVSPDGRFALGFFTPSKSKNRYIGLRYNLISDPTILWVANRENPLVDSPGVLSVTEDGRLTISNQTSFVVWSTNATKTGLIYPVAQLLDCGNLIVKHSGDARENYTWKGFNFCNDKLKPGMRIGVEFSTATGTLIAWKIYKDPWPGTYDINGDPEFYFCDGPPNITWRSGAWNGGGFSGVNASTHNNLSFNVSRRLLNYTGATQLALGSWGDDQWRAFLTSLTDGCGKFGKCSSGDNNKWNFDLPVGLPPAKPAAPPAKPPAKPAAPPAKPPTKPLAPPAKPHKSRTKVVAIIMSLVFGILLLSCICCFLRKRKRRQGVKDKSNEMDGENNLDLPLFDFHTIVSATDNFSDENKLGQGGFGPVYKGKLGEDQEVAVKRLSKTSQQGVDEFKNEVMLIAKLQHRNLVKLLGYCIQGEERMLIYEYMPNKSLDAFLFGKYETTFLNWRTRYQIIIGIARGLLYLHQDSRFRIIHRDLKASNILLDKDMVPKISDFGMARIFEGDETNFNTRKVVGTYGYMSPEYALQGTFSMKSDIFSFGVIVLEIVSGRKNRGLYAISPFLNLLAHAWSLWSEGDILQLAQERMSPVPNDEVLKCIKIGLLCVQERPEDRPLMSNVIEMFISDISSLPQPNPPGFVSRFSPPELDRQEPCSLNGASISELSGR